MARHTRAESARASAYRAREAAESATANPYLRKLIEDAELRGNIRGAFDAAKSAYGRLNNGKPATRALMDDKKVHRDLRSAADSLRAASETLRETPKKRHGLRNLIVVGVVGAGLALVLSEDLRKSVLDRLFGAEEEFEYTSTTSPSPEAAATNAS